MPRRLGFTLLIALALRFGVTAAVVAPLPAQLSDAEFWSLTERLSEPNGYFVSQSGSPDNLLSNERDLSTVAAALATQLKPSGVYLGVGPEQNFTYIAAMKPRMAFITDIRRGNLNLHLVYKALFEMTSNRIDFVARLFNRRAPVGLKATSSASDLMDALWSAEPVDEATFKANLKTLTDDLTVTHGFRLSPDDLTGVEYVYRNFYRFGPAINYTSSINGRSGGMGSYATIMGVIDRVSGAERSYLSSEATFAAVKDIERKNLIVPVVGDFAGPKALRAIGAYLREHGATVSAFYVSNVEMYLRRNGAWPAFCANVATMPVEAASVFIRPGNGMPFSSIAAETAGCAK